MARPFIWRAWKLVNNERQKHAHLGARCQKCHALGSSPGCTPAACIILPWRGFPTHSVVRRGFAWPGKCAPIRRNGRRSCLRAIDLSVAPLCGGNCDPLFAALLLPPPRNGVTRRPRSPRGPLPCFAYGRPDPPHRLGGVFRRLPPFCAVPPSRLHCSAEHLFFASRDAAANA